MEEQNPYRSPDAVVAEVSANDLAERGTRFGAAFIDGLILVALILPMMFLGGYFRAAMAAAETGEQVGFGTTLMWALVSFITFVVLQYVPLNATGQTWGKKFLGIKIVDMAGAKPSIGVLLLKRYLPWNVGVNIPFIGPLLGLANVLMIFRGDRRCGHDLIAGTKVVKGN